MKALTLWQPWASLVACGAKRVETRSWTTKYRGPIAIHAAAGGPPFKDLGASRWRREFSVAAHVVAGIELRPGRRSPKLEWSRFGYVLPAGAVLATAELYQVQEIDPTWINELSDEERIFGNYETGRFAWFLQNVRPFRRPIPAKGNRLIWNWSGVSE